MSRWRNGEAAELLALSRRGDSAPAIAEALQRPIDEVRDRLYIYRQRGFLPSRSQMQLLVDLVLAGGEIAIDTRRRKTVAACARHGWLTVLDDRGWPQDILCRLTDAGWIQGTTAEQAGGVQGAEGTSTRRGHEVQDHRPLPERQEP